MCNQLCPLPPHPSSSFLRTSGDLLMQQDVGTLPGGCGRLIWGQPCLLCLRDKGRRKSFHVSPLPKLVPRLTKGAHTGNLISSPNAAQQVGRPAPPFFQEVWDLYMDLLPPSVAPAATSSV